MVVAAKQQPTSFLNAKKIKITSYLVDEKQETVTIAGASVKDDDIVRLFDVHISKIQKKSLQTSALTAKKAKLIYSRDGYFNIKPIRIRFLEDLVIKDTGVYIKSSEGVYVFDDEKIYSFVPTLFRYKTFDFISKDGFSGELRSGAIKLWAMKVDGSWKYGG